MIRHSTCIWCGESVADLCGNCVEPNTFGLDFRGSNNYLRGQRFEVPFFTISSQRFEKVEQELSAMEMPMFKILEDQTIREIQDSIDVSILNALRMV